ncbi:DMSO reductase family type II enzyme chaperone [Marinobacterium halophilum]|uniref:DMSO reductase family type II enzyme chaperone n=1 Tax=Marinobacterium halophilum TaxID=267374 RepID=A0A2P8F3G3_9GAMM|nr:molecular chaperone TorD family protein [Marinobacterium halophilum]PSL16252.1 DMSO reductase family type II enzyme chaperone [Marinobacterium halophilum]
MNGLPSTPYGPEYVHARGVVFRLAAALLDYPLAETQQAIEEGQAGQILDTAMQQLGAAPWPLLPPSRDLIQLEVGYMATFVHGRRGKPRVPLVASAYERLLAGDTQGSFLLNVQAFYTHFGLKAATEDEGHIDEPDHLVAMLEFCALLCHLEEQALTQRRDASPYQRALRDFMARYLIPLTNTIRSRYAHENDYGLDPTLAHLLQVLPDWADSQQAVLEHQAGPYPAPGSRRIPTTSLPQGLWD